MAREPTFDEASLAMPSPEWRTIVEDMNGDGVFTISDVVAIFSGLVGNAWEVFTWLFFWPGNWLLERFVTSENSVARFLEMSPDWYNGWIAGILSAIAFLGANAVYCWWTGVFGRGKSASTLGPNEPQDEAELAGWKEEDRRYRQAVTKHTKKLPED